MGYDRPNAVVGVRMSIEEQKTVEAVNGIAFLLLTEAFLDHVQALAAVDPRTNRRLLRDAKDRAVATLARFSAERPGVGSHDTLLAVATRIQAVIDRAQDATEAIDDVAPST